jgi:hypothetical protein
MADGYGHGPVLGSNYISKLATGDLDHIFALDEISSISPSLIVIELW